MTGDRAPDTIHHESQAIEALGILVARRGGLDKLPDSDLIAVATVRASLALSSSNAELRYAIDAWTAALKNVNARRNGSHG